MAKIDPAKVSTPVLLLDRETVSSLLTLDDCIAAVEAGFLAHAQGRSLAPKLMHVYAESGEFHISNIIGLILLSDGHSGTHHAVIESRFVMGLRTGAATAVAVKYFARSEIRVVILFRKGSSAGWPTFPSCRARVSSRTTPVSWQRNLIDITWWAKRPP